VPAAPSPRAPTHNAPRPPEPALPGDTPGAGGAERVAPTRARTGQRSGGHTEDGRVRPIRSAADPVGGASHAATGSASPSGHPASGVEDTCRVGIARGANG